ncbi:serine hydrolase [Bacteroides nordii]|uniref:serine hydrolase n=1 Tax=Bacteroides nordii TaxID=291645 RepID=UPI00399AEA73
MKKSIISCILFCLILLPIQGQEINTAKIDSFLNHIEKYNQGIGSVAISKGGKTVYTRRFGQNNLNKKQNGEAFKYRIGSITKLMTATLVEQLVEQGRLNLTETFLKPRFKVQPKCRTGKFKKTFTHQDLLANMG